MSHDNPHVPDLDPDLAGTGKEMRIIATDQLGEVLDAAVLRAVREELPNERGQRIYAMQRIVRREFSRLARGKTRAVRSVTKRGLLNELERSRDRILATRDRALEELRELRKHTSTVRRQQEEELLLAESGEALGSGDFRQDLTHRFNQVFAHAEREGLERRELRDELIVAASRLIAEERARIAGEPAPDFAEESEIFERRITKLNESLREAEQALGEQRRKDGLEPGVASYYKATKGLGLDADRYELKRELLGQVFEANLLLQKA